MEFDRLGVFTYSREEDTPAYSFSDQIDDETSNKRKEEIMLLQQDIVFNKNEEMLSKEIYAFVEGKISDDDVYVARTYRDAPTVDSFVFIETDRSLMSGDFVKVRITDANEYDLIGVIVDESA